MIFINGLMKINKIMISDKDINDFYTNNIKMLEKIAAGVSYKKNRNINPSATISESYLYIYKIKDKINSIDDLQRYIIHWIKQMVGTWGNNNKLINDEGNKKIDVSYIPEVVDDFSDNIDDKIETEMWYNNVRCIMDMYKEQETNKIKLIIFDCYFNKGIIKGADMAKHLNINKNYACSYIKQLRTDIKEFYIKKKSKNDKD